VDLIKSGQIWRFFTPIVLHAGILHLFMNLFTQLRYGLYLERKWGTVKYILIYLISGIGSVLLSCLAAPMTTSVGACGAVSGLLGAHFIIIILSWKKTNPMLRTSMLSQVLFWIVLLLLTPILLKYIDFWGHLGGLICGMIASTIIFGGTHEKHGRAIQIGAITVLTLYFIVGGIVLWTFIKV